MSTQIGQFVNIPVGEDVDKVRNAFDEISDAMSFIKAKQEHVKEIKKMLKEDYDMTPKSINAVVKLLVKENADDFFEEQDELQALYETLY